MYNTSLGVIFGVKKYAEGLLKVVERKGIKVNYKHKLTEVNVPSKEAVFEVLEEDRTVTFKVLRTVWMVAIAVNTTLLFQYDFLHATPPMGPLDFMKGQPIADADGWVDVDKQTLQHKKYRKLLRQLFKGIVPRYKA